MQRQLLTSLALATLGTLAGAGCAIPETEVGEPPPDEDLGIVQQASVSCDTWTDTGYVDGDPFPITLVTVDNKPVEIDTANAYVVMQQAAAAAGVQIRIVSGFRTYAQQDYLYDCYQCCCCNSCNLAARPGYSNHQSGHALDLNTSSGAGVLSWLNNHGAQYGFTRTVPSENWHWEWWGGGPGGGPCGGDDGATGSACTVTATGETGQCMDTGACADLGGSHESTPGYCPGPSNIQCCTGTTSCTVDDTGLSGECMRTSECAALGGGHVSTPGYCPGPSDYQCCTAATQSSESSGGTLEPGGGGDGDGGGETALGGAASTEGVGQGGSGAFETSVPPDSESEANEEDEGAGVPQDGCRMAVGSGARPAAVWLLAPLVVLGSARRRRVR